jgi:hypothetical protein
VPEEKNVFYILICNTIVIKSLINKILFFIVQYVVLIFFPLRFPHNLFVIPINPISILKKTNYTEIKQNFRLTTMIVLCHY